MVRILLQLFGVCIFGVYARSLKPETLNATEGFQARMGFARRTAGFFVVVGPLLGNTMSRFGSCRILSNFLGRAAGFLCRVL